MENDIIKQRIEKKLANTDRDLSECQRKIKKYITSLLKNKKADSLRTLSSLISGRNEEIMSLAYVRNIGVNKSNKRELIAKKYILQKQMSFYNGDYLNGEKERIDLTKYRIIDPNNRIDAEIWNNYPLSEFITFQLLFSPPGYRIIPLDGNTNPNIHDCIVDPRLIQNEFAGDSLGANLKKGSPEQEKTLEKSFLVDRLKSFFKEDVVPLYTHLQNINGGQLRYNRNFRLLLIKNPDNDNYGKIIYCRYENEEERELDRKIMQITGDIYKARRRTIYASQYYQNELYKIQDIFDKLSEAHSIISEIKKGENNEDRYKKASSLISMVERIIRKAVSKKKGDIRIEIGKIRDTQDSLNRRNPSAVLARIIKLYDLLSGRNIEVSSKDPRFTEDKNLLQIMMHRFIKDMDDYYNNESNRKRSLEKLKKSSVKPFCGYLKKIELHDFNEDIYNIFKIHHEYEQVIYYETLSSPLNRSPDYVKHIYGRLSGIISNNTGLSEDGIKAYLYRIPGYKERLKEFKRKYEEFRKIKEMTLKQKDDFHTLFLDFLKNIGFENYVI